VTEVDFGVCTYIIIGISNKGIGNTAYYYIFYNVYNIYNIKTKQWEKQADYYISKSWLRTRVH
jgi:hypothetical protein